MLEMNLKQIAARSMKIVLIISVLGNITLVFYLPFGGVGVASKHRITWKPGQIGNKTSLEQDGSAKKQDEHKVVFTDNAMHRNKPTLLNMEKKLETLYASYISVSSVHTVKTTASKKEKTDDMKIQHYTYSESDDVKRSKCTEKNGSDNKKVKNCSTVSEQRFMTMYRPKGQLGNQMFQLAVLLGLANRTNHIPFLSTHFSELDLVFDLPATLYKKVDSSGFAILTQNGINRFRDVERIDPTLNWTLNGYFQFYKAFSNTEEKVRDIFKFKPLFVKIAKVYLANNVPAKYVKVGLHVRRRDFISAFQQKLGRKSADVEYFNRAREYYRSQFKNVTFIVVSDDKQWSRKHLKSNDTVFSDHNHKGVDLAILSLCDHNIMSVGTYGWWGAWLAGGTVVYYGQQFRPGSVLAKHFVMEEFYPPQWIRF